MNNNFSLIIVVSVTTKASLLKSGSTVSDQFQQNSFSQANVESRRLSFAQNFFSYVLPQNETFIRNWLFNFFSILMEFIPKNVPAGNSIPLLFLPQHSPIEPASNSTKGKGHE